MCINIYLGSYNKYVTYDSLAADYLNATKSFALFSPEVGLVWERFMSKSWKSKGFESAFQSLEERLNMRQLNF